MKTLANYENAKISNESKCSKTNIVGFPGVVQQGGRYWVVPSRPLRLGLVSLFYSQKVSLEFEIKNIWLIYFS